MGRSSEPHRKQCCRDSSSRPPTTVLLPPSAAGYHAILACPLDCKHTPSHFRSFLLEYGTSSSSRRFVHSNLNGSCEETNYNEIEPRESPKPQPLGNGPFVILFTTCTLCAIFILWRRASMIRAVVGHRYGYYYVTAHLCIKPAFSVLKIGQERGKVPSVYPSMMAPLHMNFCKTITTKTTRT